MSFNPKSEPLTKQDLKEVSTNYLKSVIKNTDDKQLINNCLEEIKERTTPTFFNGSENIDIKTKYNCVSAIYSETTDQNKPIDIYIKKAKKDSIYIDNEFLIVFHFTGCLNPNYGHSYYIDTILKSKGGLCLNTYPLESLDSEKMDCVRAFIEGFLITNKINLEV